MMNLTYEEAMARVNSRLRFGMKAGFERIRSLLNELGNPHEKLKFVHVGGTYGKGSTSTLIASALEAAGYKTGLYTSPFVIDFRERFMINHEMISKQQLIEAIEAVSTAIESLEAEDEQYTEFEFITALALFWFAKESCDIVVLEVGLGGRLDTTNVIPQPEVTVITSISLDHTDILGDTIEKIAAEKAGIIKGGRVVLYPVQEEAAVEVIRKTCNEKEAELTVPNITDMSVLSESINGTDFTYQNESLHTPFLGEHQVYNAITAHAALQELKKIGWEISESAIKNGFSEAFIPARMEIISRNPLVILDGGHNPGAAEALRNMVKKYLPRKKIVAVIGMMADKDSREYFRQAGNLFETIITVDVSNKRAMPREELKGIAMEFCDDVVAAPSLAEALETADRKLDENGVLIVTGSLYLAGEIRGLLRTRYSSD